MKYVRYRLDDEVSWGELDQEDLVYPLNCAPYLGGKRTDKGIPLTSVTLLAPCEPSKIVAAGKNYYDHMIEMGEGIFTKPVLFLKANNCINDPEGSIPYPQITRRLDYEGELAVVIGKTAKSVKAAKAEDYIFGYTILNDVTARDIQKSDGQWTRGKCMDLFAPVGPWIVTGLSPSNLELITRLNGEVRQHTSTAKLMCNVFQMLEFITEFMTLLPGDLIATGTPAGVGPMQVGDIVEVEIEGIGILRNNIVEG